MCGIAGVIAPKQDSIKTSHLVQMSDSLRHRGPDDSGFLLYNRESIHAGRDWPSGDRSIAVALLHLRLSILDLSPAGWQPMSTPDGRYHIVFNGEIYNYIELREELKGCGHVFSSSSDTEVLLAAYAEWGIKALNKLVGMFAFAILDINEQVVFLARDFFGIKPLYYTVGDPGFAFASEIKGLTQLPWVSKTINPTRAFDFFRYGLTSHGSGTIFQHIQQLPAAHYMVIDINQPKRAEPVQYWTADKDRQVDLSFEEASSTLRDLFLENIKLHIRSDVPIGSALSGGIDSSAIVMAIRHVTGNEVELNNFCYIAEDEKINEEPWIDMINSASGAHVHKVSTNPQELQADLKRMIYMYDEPLPSTGNYAEYRLSRLTHDAGIKVLMSGQGGDEMLGGYLSYIGARLGSLLVQGKWMRAKRLISKAGALPGTSSKRIAMESLGYLLPRSIQVMLRSFSDRDLTPPWLNMKAFNERGVEPTLLIQGGKGKNLLRDNLYRSLYERGLAHMLRFEDRRSMAYSIESRVPFLTPKLSQFLLSLPEEYLISDEGTTKFVFRKAMEGIVPDKVLQRKDKLGFATPEKKWVMGVKDWVDDNLAGDVAASIPFIDRAFIQNNWQQMKQGDAEFSLYIWRVAVFIEWMNIFSAKVD
jgi:asparagine synthase (glutamine-hydrolysing)